MSILDTERPFRKWAIAPHPETGDRPQQQALTENYPGVVDDGDRPSLATERVVVVAISASTSPVHPSVCAIGPQRGEVCHARVVPATATVTATLSNHHKTTKGRNERWKKRTKEKATWSAALYFRKAVYRKAHHLVPVVGGEKSWNKKTLPLVVLVRLRCAVITAGTMANRAAEPLVESGGTALVSVSKNQLSQTDPRPPSKESHGIIRGRLLPHVCNLNFEGYIDFSTSGFGAYVLLIVANACGSVLVCQVLEASVFERGDEDDDRL
jgi:hypothetical protein